MTFAIMLIGFGVGLTSWALLTSLQWRRKYADLVQRIGASEDAPVARVTFTKEEMKNWKGYVEPEPEIIPGYSALENRWSPQPPKIPAPRRMCDGAGIYVSADVIDRLESVMVERWSQLRGVFDIPWLEKPRAIQPDCPTCGVNLRLFFEECKNFFRKNRG